MRCANQFFRVGSFFAFKTRVKSIRLLVQHAALSRYCSLPAFDIAFPMCLTFLMDCHCCSPVGLKGNYRLREKQHEDKQDNPNKIRRKYNFCT